MSNGNDDRKAVRAKLYNLKSGVDGLIQMVEADVMSPDQAIDGAAALVANLSKSSNSGN